MIIIFVQYLHNNTYFDAAIANLTHKTITHGSRKGQLFVMKDFLQCLELCQSSCNHGLN